MNADIFVENDTLYVKGKLNFKNVMFLYEKSLPMFRSHKIININFSQLESGSSAGVALMIEWLKFVNSHQLTIHFKSISEDLLAIAKVAGLREILEKASD